MATLKLNAVEDDPALTVLHFSDGQTAAAVLEDNLAVTGLTIDNPGDTDWYRFQFAQAPSSFGMTINSVSLQDELLARLYREGIAGLEEIGRSVASAEISPDHAEILVAAAPAPSGGQLGGDAHFSLIVDGTEVAVTVAADTTNDSLLDLLANINTAVEAALQQAGVDVRIVAAERDGRITLSSPGLGDLVPLEIRTDDDDPTVTELHFADGQGFDLQTNAMPLSAIENLARITGLSLHTTTDVDWLRLDLADDGSITLESLDGVDMTLELFDRLDGPCSNWPSAATLRSKCELRPTRPTATTARRPMPPWTTCWATSMPR